MRPAAPVVDRRRPIVAVLVWAWRLVVWAAATGLALLFAWKTKVGPSYGLTSRHGIHVGDVAAFVVVYAWAALLTVPPRQRDRSG